MSTKIYFTDEQLLIIRRLFNRRVSELKELGNFFNQNKASIVVSMLRKINQYPDTYLRKYQLETGAGEAEEDPI